MKTWKHFPLPYQMRSARNVNYLHSIWLGIWSLFLGVFYLFLWHSVTRPIIVGITALMIVSVQALSHLGLRWTGCLIWTVRNLAYSVLGGLDSADVNREQFMKGLETHTERVKKVLGIETPE